MLQLLCSLEYFQIVSLSQNPFCFSLFVSYPTHEKNGNMFLQLWQCVRIQKQNIWGQPLTTTQKNHGFLKGFNMIKVFTLVIKDVHLNSRLATWKTHGLFKLHWQFKLIVTDRFTHLIKWTQKILLKMAKAYSNWPYLNQ